MTSHGLRPFRSSFCVDRRSVLVWAFVVSGGVCVCVCVCVCDVCVVWCGVVWCGVCVCECVCVCVVCVQCGAVCRV